MKVIYKSNNSGGRWWLKDKDWLALKSAGWELAPVYRPGKDGRWLGAMCTEASKDFQSPADAMREFERITRLEVSDEGCNCCGPPHSFSWPEGYASGEKCLEHLFPGKRARLSKREMLEADNE